MLTSTDKRHLIIVYGILALTILIYLVWSTTTLVIAVGCVPGALLAAWHYFKFALASTQ